MRSKVYAGSRVDPEKGRDKTRLDDKDSNEEDNRFDNIAYSPDGDNVADSADGGDDGPGVGVLGQSDFQGQDVEGQSDSHYDSASLEPQSAYGESKL